MSRTARLLCLLQELRARRRPVTAEVLAAALRVSVRTLYRDINLLRVQGACIEGEAGLGYVMKPGFLLPPLMFSPEELDVILLGASWVARRRDLAMEATARSALAKISAVLPDDAKDMFDLSGLLVGSAKEAKATTVDVAMIRDALRRERKLAISYADAADIVSKRVVWPVAIAVFDDTQLLAAWCELRDSYRHFRLDRIYSVEVLSERPLRRRMAMYKEWREQELACVPESIHERDVS